MEESTPFRHAGLTGRFESLEEYAEFVKNRRANRTPRGEKHANAKLTNNQVSEIRRRYISGELTARQLADEYGISAASVDNIVNGTTWGHVEEIDPEQLAALRTARKLESRAKATQAMTKLTEDQVRAIRAEYVKGNGKALAAKYGVKQPTISDIVTRRTWNHI
ncbi:hypothetical protein [Paenibacillus sp. MMO-177]|uniref:hypothetical protein n=1 Tax=Paenibacillus sp. MMO-177 TaxID=3081289 RepID=UPI00301B20A0